VGAKNNCKMVAQSAEDTHKITLLQKSCVSAANTFLQSGNTPT
jgi:hypothetical protein